MRKISISLSYLLVGAASLFGTTNEQMDRPDAGELVEMDCPIIEVSCRDNYSDKMFSNLQSLFWNRMGPNAYSGKPDKSANWAGHAAFQGNKKRAVSEVSGSWRVPTLTATPDNSYSTAWVGIDGYEDNNTVEQIGTRHDWVNNSQVNFAWFQMYPNPTYQLVGFPVNSNDVITAKVTYKVNGIFSLKITNVTQGVFTVVPETYTYLPSADRSSAEWVVGALSSPYGVLPLANFGAIEFTEGVTVIGGRIEGIRSSRWDDESIQMRDPSTKTTKATAKFAKKGSGFTVTWKHE